ncbi:MAG: hypothetical protein GY765_26565, partial [bacterium]|nr:hypothetical protein [bacterium]
RAKMQQPSWEEFNKDIYDFFKQGTVADEAIIKEVEKDVKKRTKIQKKSKHSDCVVVVDKEGNVAAMVHSINSMYYGYGLMVDGVSISDTAASMQEFLLTAGPGKRLPAGTNQVVVLKKGKPFLATACIGSVLLEDTMQSVVNVLDFGMDPKASLETPYFRSAPIYSAENNMQVVIEGQFSKELIEAVRGMGQPVKVVPVAEQWSYTGAW